MSPISDKKPKNFHPPPPRSKIIQRMFDQNKIITAKPTIHNPLIRLSLLRKRREPVLTEEINKGTARIVEGGELKDHPETQDKFRSQPQD